MDEEDPGSGLHHARVSPTASSLSRRGPPRNSHSKDRIDGRVRAWPSSHFTPEIRMPSPIDWYDSRASELAPRYEAIDPARLHAWLADLLPGPGSRALDVGAGTGRDAAWLAGQGLHVIAVEPSRGMREQASRHHPPDTVRWIDDCLPDLNELHRLGLRAELILLSAVWMHLAPAHRPRAFERLAGLLAPGGLLAITLRSGPAPADSGMHPVSAPEVAQLAAAQGAAIVRRRDTPDAQGRPDVSWIAVAIRSGQAPVT